MKLVRYGAVGRERPGIVDRGGTVRDLSGIVNDIDGAAISPSGLARLRALHLESLPAASGTERLGPCVARPGKFICIGLNYADHAAETGVEVPKANAVTSMNNPLKRRLRAIAYATMCRSAPSNSSVEDSGTRARAATASAR